ncbi:hypothetical protein GCM10009733_090480 [Nonomuraea maheshkhaliensis]|uniref:GNAT family N-acetyltransferase n=1 Tax=Nonomuraea maheshkhaliensis TaxID=419590 RepID=A0ABN2H0Z6_9ACTN
MSISWVTRPEEQRDLSAIREVLLAAFPTALDADLVDAARDAGESLVLVLGHPAYHPRFGFVRASAYGIRAPSTCPTRP